MVVISFLAGAFLADFNRLKKQLSYLMAKAHIDFTFKE
jgi:hypothetical protein